ncbi:MAG: hypothetical protein H3C26_06320 [Rhodocyclaceae bacterium]|nr:hypothetical protein [Rhodocyclaceae bacterium]
MKIESLYAPPAGGTPSVGAQGGADDFRETLARTEAAATTGADRAPAPTAEDKAAARAALLKKIEDYLNKSPAERMREKILAQMGLTEESLAQLPPEKRAEIEEEIGRRIKEWLLSGKEPAPGEAMAAAEPGMRGAGAVGDSPAGMAAFAGLQASLAGAARGV